MGLYSKSALLGFLHPFKCAKNQITVFNQFLVVIVHQGVRRRDTYFKKNKIPKQIANWEEFYLNMSSRQQKIESELNYSIAFPALTMLLHLSYSMIQHQGIGSFDNG